MGVYIKGTNKKHILTIFQANGLSPKLMGIELVEVPEPHGRLIDAEYLKEHLYQCDINGMPLHIMELDERLACISDVPTIIEAEDEPQTDTEIAKAIVHKMIDDAVIAEDAYPDLRQKMHDAVDEYEPQTDCPYREYPCDVCDEPQTKRSE